MVKFLNNLDGSKLAIVWSFIIALAALIFIGIHLIVVDGRDAIPEIAFMEQVVQTVLLAGGGISTVHVVTGAIVQAKAKNQQQQPPELNGAKNLGEIHS